MKVMKVVKVMKLPEVARTRPIGTALNAAKTVFGARASLQVEAAWPSWHTAREAALHVAGNLKSFSGYASYVQATLAPGLPAAVYNYLKPQQLQASDGSYSAIRGMLSVVLCHVLPVWRSARGRSSDDVAVP